SQVYSYLRQHPTKPLSDTLEMMLSTEAVRQQAVKEHAIPTDAQVDARVNKLLKQLREGPNPAITPSQTDDQFLAARHVTRAQLRTNFRSQVEAESLAMNDLTRNLGHPIGPDDMVQARHILVMIKDPAPDATPEVKAKADAEALAKIKLVQSD